MGGGYLALAIASPSPIIPATAWRQAIILQIETVQYSTVQIETRQESYTIRSPRSNCCEHLMISHQNCAIKTIRRWTKSRLKKKSESHLAIIILNHKEFEIYRIDIKGPHSKRSPKNLLTSK